MTSTHGTGRRDIETISAELRNRLDELSAANETRRPFLATYLRTTIAVGDAVSDARFEDPKWVEDWDVAFADLYLAALDADLAGQRVARPWRLAFDAPAALPDLRHVLLGINAHINYDLPQALLAVISDEQFTDTGLLERRRGDHQRIDHVLAARVAAENDELPPETLLDRLLTPLNRLGTKRFLKEAREKVWHNTLALQAARLAGPDAYAVRLAELELLSAARIADLLASGQVLLRLAIAGFGVTLPPPLEGGESRGPTRDEV